MGSQHRPSTWVQNRTSPAPHDEARTGHPLPKYMDSSIQPKDENCFLRMCHTVTVVHLRTSFDHSPYIRLFHSSLRSHQQLQKYFTPCELGLLHGSINDLKPEVHLHNICTLNFYLKPNTRIPMTYTKWLMVFNDINVFDSAYTKQINTSCAKIYSLNIRTCQSQ